MVLRYLLIEDLVCRVDNDTNKYSPCATLPMDRRDVDDVHIQFYRSDETLYVSGKTKNSANRWETDFAGPVFEIDSSTGVAVYPMTGGQELECLALHLSKQFGDRAHKFEIDPSIIGAHKVEFDSSGCVIVKAQTGFDVYRIIADLKKQSAIA